MPAASESSSAHFITLGNLVPGTVAVTNTDEYYKVRDIRTKLYKQYPNEEMERYPLTKIVLSGKGRILDRVKCEWGMDAYDPNYFQVLGVFSDSGLSTAITDACTKGTTVYVATSKEDARRVIPMESIELRVIRNDVVEAGAPAEKPGTVHSVMLDVVNKGEILTFGYIQAVLLEDEVSNSNLPCSRANSGQYYSSYGSLISYAAPENSTIPPGRYREPTLQFNYSQIIMEGLSITGSELADKSVFDEETYARYYRQTMDRFHEKFERMLKFGVRAEGTGTVSYMGQTETFKRWWCGGLSYFIKHNASDNYIQIPRLTTFEGENFSGKNWANYGEWFFQLLMNKLSKKSGSRKKVFVSSTGRLIINELLKQNTAVEVGPFTKDKWGFDVQEIHGMNCKLELHQDAGLSVNPAWERMMIIVEPEKIEFRPRKGRDLTVIRSQKDVKAAIENGWTWRDGIREGVFIDGTVTFDDLDGMAIVEGLGENFGS